VSGYWAVVVYSRYPEKRRIFIDSSWHLGSHRIRGGETVRSVRMIGNSLGPAA
jgi:hypothetical protein